MDELRVGGEGEREERERERKREEDEGGKEGEQGIDRE